MNRLTIRNQDGSVVQPDTTSWTSVFKKLAEYEDTGYEPAEILDVVSNKSFKESESRVGELIMFKGKDGSYRNKCSVCGYEIPKSIKKINYCPICGALTTKL